MKRLLIGTICAIAIMFLMGCATTTIQPVKISTYPHVAPNDPAIVTALDDIFAAAASDEWSVLGFGADINNDIIVWFSDPEGTCMCILVGFSTGDLMPLPSCEDGLEVWNDCVDDGYCGTTTGEMPTPNEDEGTWL
jgi:hypothetical protein